MSEVIACDPAGETTGTQVAYNKVYFKVRFIFYTFF